MSFITFFLIIINQGWVQYVSEAKHAIFDIIINLGMICRGWITLLNSRFHNVLVLQWIVHCVQVNHIAITFGVSYLDAHSTTKCLR